MKALLLTNEYPPHVYGGAGVHVEYLSRELAKLIDVEVRCFGDQSSQDGRLRVRGYAGDSGRLAEAPAALRSPLDAILRGAAFNGTPIDADVVHCHTWYTHLGGIAARLLYGRPLVITTHSLEPSRAWKRDQLGRGYDFSTWVEKTALESADAVIAVSRAMKADIERLFAVDPARVVIIYNGIDPDEYRPAAGGAALTRYGIDAARPYVLFVGRITRQKGILHLVRAIGHLRSDAQVVLCAGAPDTPEIGAAMTAAVRALQERRPGVIWIPEMVDKPAVIELYTHAAVFCCPSIYEPFGIINLEAMACGTAVVASAVGGIREVVVPEETGLLVPFDAEADGEPRDAERFARDLAAALDRVLADPALQQRFGAAGRARVEREFSWSAIARATARVYTDLVGG
jgi:glycogen synthase